MLAAIGLGKRFERFWAFRGVSFELGVGASLVVTGHNGSGKSTLLKVLAGLLPPTEGEQRMEGALGLAALDLQVYPNLSCREHLELTADLRGCESRWRELLEKVELPQAADKHAGKLSTGMRSRLRLAISIQHDPGVLLLDEPTAAMDEHGLALVERIVAEQRQRGCVVIATNEPRDRRLATHELSMDD